ncbi:hypothetical protein TIFTF001_026671 [Ficus carica]|uniref:Uncharacterized protein n=1 Tax=Ficus carica TaxID=3494 RepID=A0AA88DLP9_FICCA|nr:hypothetical protein TIFTF001_026671 [Ficus carica]
MGQLSRCWFAAKDGGIHDREAPKGRSQGPVGEGLGDPLEERRWLESYWCGSEVACNSQVEWR